MTLPKTVTQITTIIVKTGVTIEKKEVKPNTEAVVPEKITSIKVAVTTNAEVNNNNDNADKAAVVAEAMKIVIKK